MKKIIAAFLVLLMLAVPVMAQPTITSAAPKIKAYVILGKGIAASPSDPMDFKIVKVGIGRVITVNGTDMAVGILVADEERYRLREIVIEEGHATGNIYSKDGEVGSFDVSSVMKGDTEIWAGEMKLNGDTYHLYVIEGVRQIKAGELRDKVVEYCNNNEDANCKGRLANYCENNPDDSRCKALFRAYCLRENNMDDTRCRVAFRNWCEEHPENKHCVPFALNRAKVYCEEHSDSNLCRRIATNVVDYCKDNPDNEGCLRVRELVRERPELLKKISTLRNRLHDLRVNATLESAELTNNTVDAPVLSADVGGD
ncbi:MAG: hypothetical protein KAT37_03545 [Candidatus Aenigmarchaeota archaeon]|nr:hypothetical protein [Candidatus Aenigmarchaeota archaeon]